ncbi:unnamed protein product [Rotaria magnacalcarata]|uniref:G-patch domain-containing protein n=1 Tax=Rotaria magnacalcarata TaxID=392030 RepID=A0A815E1H2_9BILA|nr:unnamed protein product [Rotaria magnacalcarata]CAF1375913.1 unnamed protein product [Rotaria magnacalcarata]CAF2105972.1 unnamed protein product [Rotaria magnacalcarata]CAF2129330.1 unnamed protein product [Rotaria magnacalcarata]CAF2172058.1 unnamed protein product [Rotaria magnacalcarata]
MSSFSARLLKAQRKHKVNSDITDIIEETRRCLNLSNDRLSSSKFDSVFETESNNIPNIIPWWEDNHEEIFENKIDHDAMLATADDTLKKIVDGALDLMLTNSKSKIQKQIKIFVDRKKLKRSRRNTRSNDIHSDIYSERIVESLKNNNFVTPINSTNVGHQLLEKIGWTPGNGLGLNQNGIKTPIEINIRNRRQGLGYEKSIDQ